MVCFSALVFLHISTVAGPTAPTPGAGFRAGRSFSHAMLCTGLKGCRPVDRTTVGGLFFCVGFFTHFHRSRPYSPDARNGLQGRSLVFPSYAVLRAGCSNLIYLFCTLICDKFQPLVLRYVYAKIHWSIDSYQPHRFYKCRLPHQDRG